MSESKYNELNVRASLDRKQDVRIEGNSIFILSNKVWSNEFEKMVPNPKKRHDLGNGSWGKIDYLTNHCGYRSVRVENFGNARRSKNRK